MRTVLVCSVAALSTVARAEDTQIPASIDARQQVLNLTREWVAAENKHDATALRRILDDKFVSSSDASRPRDKEAFIKGITAGDVDPTQSQALTDETVIVDGDTAIVIGTDTFHRTGSGAPSNLKLRYTVTYIHRHARWVALAEHVVTVPPNR
jgi:ketosteroid isomerase-like protein